MRTLVEASVGTVRDLTPQLGSQTPLVVPVDHDAPYVLVMRDDTDHCVGEIASRLDAPAVRCQSLLRRAYQCFLEELRSALESAVGDPNGIEFHVVDADHLAKAVRARVRETQVISLDPLIDSDDGAMELSRGFLLGGNTSLGLVRRPGAASISRQLEALGQRLAGVECAVIEDDIFTGRSLTHAVQILRRAQIRVTQVVPGIQSSSAEPVPGVRMDPVIEYALPSPLESSRVNLLDPRNFLLGMSGLVVRLPDYGWGRAPYWLPFVDIVARAGVTRGRELSFAVEMLQANARFFARAEQAAGRTIRVADLQPSTRRLFLSLEIATGLTPVRTVLGWLEAHLDHYTARVQWIGRRQNYRRMAS